MSQDDQEKPMIENVSREVLQKALRDGEAVSLEKPKDAAPAEPKKQPPGTVERILNYLDRHLLLVAARAYCAQDGHRGSKDSKNLDRLLMFLRRDEVQDYHTMIDDNHEDAMIRWQGEREIYKRWRGYKAGAVTRKQLEEMYPDFNFEKEPPKPALRSPDISDADRCGADAVFHIASKLDAWIQAVLEKAEWDASKDWQIKFGLALQEKFGIKGE